MSPVDSQLRVLIVRLGAMGDILHALPAVTALREAHPEWWLGWAVEPRWRALVAAQGCAMPCDEPDGRGEPGARDNPQRISLKPRDPAMPLVDCVHTVAAKQWARRPLAPATLRDLLSSRRELREAGYDICLDLQGAVRSAVIARWAQPKRLIGEAEPREPIARWWFTERVATRGVHVIEQAAEVASAIAGDSLLPSLPSLPYDPQAEAWCRTHAPKAPFVLLSPGAGWGAKRWPLAKYAEVALALSAQGFAIVINASPSEQALGEQLASLSSASLLVPTLSQLIELTRRCALAIAGDTGPLHLASALGRPTVGIFGPTDPVRNGPYHGSHVVLRHPKSRRDHTRRSEPEAGLLTITPEEVIAASRALLSGDLPAAGPTPGPMESQPLGWQDSRIGAARQSGDHS